MLDARRLRRHEILEVNRLSPCPNTLGPAKIGDPASGRDASAGENHGTTGSTQIFRKSHDTLLHSSNVSIKRPTAPAFPAAAQLRQGACISGGRRAVGALNF